MVNVAIAGGTGAVGRTLVEVLASQDKHHAIILTRKVLPKSRRIHTMSDQKIADLLRTQAKKSKL